MTDRMLDERRTSERKFVWLMAFVAVFLAALPALFAVLSTPAGASYVGYQYNTDDHMVYAAWMRQAMDGRFFFDNRFTTDPQPGLTVHLFFFVLGLVAKVTGIVVATIIARLALSGLFVWLAYRLVRRLEWEVYATKLAIALIIFGGGLGFLVWHNFGQAIVRPSPFASLFEARLPTDVWQPEGFVFPSMLTNSLFMVSLCLILGAFLSFLSAREKPRAVIPGVLAIGLLMNIHSYDVLLVALVMVGLLGASFVQRQVTVGWILRAIIIACGAIPAAVWFVHVLHNDPVFQSRAATETFSPNFRQVFFGYLPLIGLALFGALHRASSPEERPRRLAGIGLALALLIGLFAAASGHDGASYYMGAPAFAAVLVLALVAVALASDTNPTWNLLFSWALVGTVAIYFPGLFQRKLAMGLSIPWAILAAYGLHAALRNQERSARNLALTLGIILLGASSFRWLAREITFIRTNVANTARHPVYLTQDVQGILDYLNREPGKKVVLALPGNSSPVLDAETNNPIPDEVQSPILPDLAPFCSGFAGAYTYAGHWSETPQYNKKTTDMYRFFFREIPGGRIAPMTDDERRAFARGIGANYAIVPVQESYPTYPLVPAESLGEKVAGGSQFQLIRLRR